MISIITPTLNNEKFIEDCIKNVLAQNCPDLEHLIIDGGSTDSSLSIIRQYASQYPHIQWISEKDKGQSDAMNKGIRLAKGEILGFLNADDYYEPGILNQVEGLFRSLPEPALLVGNCNFWDKNGDLMYVLKPKGLTLFKILCSPTQNPFPANSSQYFYHKKLHEIIGPYKVDEHYVMDLDFILRAVQAAHVHYVDKTFGSFRYHENSKTYQIRRKENTKIREKNYLSAYRKNLSAFQRIYSAISYTYYESEAFQRIRYYLKNLNKLFAALQRKFFSESSHP